MNSYIHKQRVLPIEPLSHSIQTTSNNNPSHTKIPTETIAALSKLSESQPIIEDISKQVRDILHEFKKSDLNNSVSEKIKTLEDSLIEKNSLNINTPYIWNPRNEVLRLYQNIFNEPLQTFNRLELTEQQQIHRNYQELAVRLLGAEDKNNKESIAQENKGLLQSFTTINEQRFFQDIIDNKLNEVSIIVTLNGIANQKSAELPPVNEEMRKIQSILSEVNPNKAFSLDQNKYIVGFLEKIERPLIEFSKISSENQAGESSPEVLFKLTVIKNIENTLKNRLKKELSTVRFHTDIKNTYKGSLGIVDGLNAGKELDADIGKIASKLMKFGFEDLASELIERRIRQGSLDETAVKLLKNFNLHNQDLANPDRQDKRLFKNPGASEEFYQLISAIFSEDIKSSKYLNREAIKTLDHRIDLANTLLATTQITLSPQPAPAPNIRNTIANNLYQIFDKIEIDLKQSKTILDILKEQKFINNDKYYNELFLEKLNSILSRKDSEDKLLQLQLNEDHTLEFLKNLKKEDPESQDFTALKRFIQGYLSNVQTLEGLTATTRASSILDIPLNHRIVNELIEEHLLAIKEAQFSKEPKINNLYTNLVESLNTIIKSKPKESEPEIEKLTDISTGKPINSAISIESITPEQIYESNNGKKTTVKELIKNGLKSKLTKQADQGNLSSLEDLNANQKIALKLVVDIFKEISSASEFQKELSDIIELTMDKKIPAVLRKALFSNAFEATLNNQHLRERDQIEEISKNNQHILSIIRD
jgi:hypothetical protein